MASARSLLVLKESTFMNNPTSLFIVDCTVPLLLPRCAAVRCCYRQITPTVQPGRFRCRQNIGTLFGIEQPLYSE
jgi:hypothetical protein